VEEGLDLVVREQGRLISSGLGEVTDHHAQWQLVAQATAFLWKVEEEKTDMKWPKLATNLLFF